MPSFTGEPDLSVQAGGIAPCGAALVAARYPTEERLADRLRSDPAMGQVLKRADLIRRRSTARSRLLANAVQVSTVTVPSLDVSLHRLREVAPDDRPVDAFVYPGGEVNAFLIELETHRLVGFSSAAIEHLSADELAFVAGHELGHAAYAHANLPAAMAVDDGIFTGDKARLARAWQRAAEISADRVGVLCAGSADVAISALFRTLSGLRHAGPHLRDELLRQWDSFADAVVVHGPGEQWELSHPHPLLRLRAAWLFGSKGSSSESNDEVDRMLAFMDPTFTERYTGAGPEDGLAVVDPYLAAFAFWGGIHVIGIQQLGDVRFKSRLRRLCPAGVALDQELADPGLAFANALANMKRARGLRAHKLATQDIYTVLDAILGAADLASRDAEARQRFTEAAEIVGVGAEAARLILERKSKDPT